MSEVDPEATPLEAEGRLFGRYLLGRVPAPDVAARYAAACRSLWPEPPTGPDAARLAWVHRHPWSLGPLEAAAALLDPGGSLRSRVLVAAAVLETTPTHADDFLPDSPTRLVLLLRLADGGLRAVTKAGVGALLWPLAGRSAR